MYPHLFSPIRINHVEVKNRIAYPALGLLYSSDSKLNDRYFHYFRERAEGGAGIVTVGPVGIDTLGSGALVLSLAEDDAIPDFRKLTGIIQAGGARAWIQLFHAGAYSHPALIENRQPIAPSPIYSPYSRTTPREMTLKDIAAVQEAFVRAAERARDAGFDGVEVIGSAGYLISQFLSPLKNQRSDAYGGSFQNRTRFPGETIEKLRRRLGPDYPLTIRMAGNDFVKGSNTGAEAPRIARVYEASGVDAINVTGGWHESRVPQLPMHLPRSAFAYLALNIKRAVSVPVMASNRISDPERAEALIRDGYADMVNLGRVLIADPKWPQKALAGRAEEIRPCVGCAQGCMDELFSGRPVFCVGNPAAGFEEARRLTPTTAPKQVMVIGAGPAGLEAAMTAARRGHRPVIYEKDGDIGGQLWLAGAPPHKQEILEFIRYYRAMIDKYRIPLVLNTEMSVGHILEEKPDHVIVAEGAEPLAPTLAGADGPRVLSAWTVLRQSPFLGKSAAVIGGGSVGLETALFVAAKGTLSPETLHFLFTYEAESPERLRELMFKGSTRVTVFEMRHKVGIEVGKSTRWVLFDNLRKHRVRLRTGARVLSVENGKVVYEKDGKRLEEAFDQVILASGARPVARLSQAMAQTGIPYTAVGDCLEPGKINHAIHGGFLAAIEI